MLIKSEIQYCISEYFQMHRTYHRPINLVSCCVKIRPSEGTDATCPTTDIQHEADVLNENTVITNCTLNVNCR